MAELMISGSNARSGSIQVSGAKNAALPLMAACLLTEKDVTLLNVPNISEVDSMKKQLEAFGVRVSGDGQTLVLNAKNAKSEPENGYNPTRGGFTVLGPLVARFAEAKVLLPSGCQIGKSGRPINYHIKELGKMGAKKFSPDNKNYVLLKAEGQLRHREDISFENVSVGATENVMLAACLANGTTVITNAAVEPEVINLVDMLKKMGASIIVEVAKDKHHKNKITINGQTTKRKPLLSGNTTHTVIPDRIEAGSYAIAAAISGGPLLLKMDPNVGEIILSIVVKALEDAGVEATWKRNGLLVKRISGEINAVHITTGPYPKFPTDLLPQWVTFMTLAQGKSEIEDTIYDNRFKHVKYLKEMGASLTKKSDGIYIVSGPTKLEGKRVKAEDLRGGFALILAGMAAAKGTTVLKNVEEVQRGYGSVKEKLVQCGAELEELAATPPGHYGHS